MSDQSQKIVYTVNNKNVVERKEVKLGQLEGGLRIIRSGLNPDELVIINGTQRVRPGAVANPQEGKITAKSKELIPKELEEFFKQQATESPTNPEQQPTQATNSSPPATNKAKP